MTEETRCWNDLAKDNARLRSANAKLVEAAKDAQHELDRLQWLIGDQADHDSIDAVQETLKDAIAEAEAQP